MNASKQEYHALPCASAWNAGMGGRTFHGKLLTPLLVPFSFIGLSVHRNYWILCVPRKKRKATAKLKKPALPKKVKKVAIM